MEYRLRLKVRYCVRLAIATKSHLNFVAFALFTSLPHGCLLIAFDLFRFRIEVKSLIQANGDVCQVAGRHCSVVSMNIADRLSSIDNTLEEVSHVVAGFFALVQRQQSVFGKWLILQRFHGGTG